MPSDEISEAINLSFKEPNEEIPKDPNELVATLRVISIHDIIWLTGLDNESNEIMGSLNDSSVSFGDAVNTLIDKGDLLDILSYLEDVSIFHKIEQVLNKLSDGVLIGLDS